MSKIAYIRLATYVVFILAIVASRHQVAVIPIDFQTYNDSAYFSMGRWSGPVAEFTHPKRSIPEVLRLAEEEARFRNWNLNDPRLSSITLQKSESRIIWVVTYDDPRDGGLSGNISIDDSTGLSVRKLKESEPNQSPEPTTTAVTPRADARVAPAAVAAHL